MELVVRFEKRVPGLGERAEDAGTLDQHYVPTRYPNGLPGGFPFEAFGPSQAVAALGMAERFLALSIERVRGK